MLVFAKQIILKKPISDWFLQMLDDLHEVEYSVTLSNVMQRKVHKLFMTKSWILFA